MNFEKKLIILSGSGDAKGTVSIERSAYGTYATVNVYNVPDLRYGEYGLGIKTPDGSFTRGVGGLGRIMGRYKLPDLSLSEVHCVVFEQGTEKVVLYGTNARTRLWESNLMDGIRSKQRETGTDIQSPPSAAAQEALPNYSGRPKEIGDYFLEIIPADSAYRDDAVAEVNYYPSNLAFTGSGDGAQKQAETAGETADAPPRQKTNETASEKNEASASNAHAAGEPKTAQSFGSPDEPPVLPRKDESTAVWQEAAATLSPFAAQAERAKKPLPSDLEQRYLYRHRRFAQTENAKQKEAEMADTHSMPHEPSAVPNPQAAAEEPKQAATPEPMPRAADGTEPFAAARKTPVSEVPPIVLSNGSTVIDAVPAGRYSAQDAVAKTHTSASFYEQIASQIEELFAVNERFTLLESLMPDTKWVKIHYDGEGKYYAVGIIGARPDYLCYGVPGSFSPQPPPELDGYCQWLPADPTKPEESGFWLMYQDASTGESVQQL